MNDLEKSELKQISKQMNAIERKILPLEQERRDIIYDLEPLYADRAALREEKSKITSGKPTISDSAYWSYMKEFEGVDEADIYTKIMTDGVEEIFNRSGKGKVDIGAGMVAIIKNNAVIAINRKN